MIFLLFRLKSSYLWTTRNTVKGFFSSLQYFATPSMSHICSAYSTLHSSCSCNSPVYWVLSSPLMASQSPVWLCPLWRSNTVSQRQVQVSLRRRLLSLYCPLSRPRFDRCRQRTLAGTLRGWSSKSVAPSCRNFPTSPLMIRRRHAEIQIEMN